MAEDKGARAVTTDADGFYGYAFHHKGKQFARAFPQSSQPDLSEVIL